MDAIKNTDRDDKLRALWGVVKRLPKPNHDNLSYVVQFLALVASYQQFNKMTPNNLSIVIAPNLIWEKEESTPDDFMGTLGRNMTLGNLYRQIVEQLVEWPKYFFENTIDFGVPEFEPKSPDGINVNSSSIEYSSNFSHQQPSQTTLPRHGHSRNASADFSKLDMSMSGTNFDSDSPKQPQRRKKQAPLPPRIGDTSSSSSPEQQRSHRETPPLNKAKVVPISAPATTKVAPVPVTPSKFGRDSATATPVPVTRLHHTGSIRRPCTEPPKPPVPVPPTGRSSSAGIPLPGSSSCMNNATGGGSKAAPPRPLPPSVAAIEKPSGMAGALETALSSSIESSSMSSSLSSGENSAVGSSAAEVLSTVNIDVTPKSVQMEVVDQTFKATVQNTATTGSNAPIGFEHLDDTVNNYPDSHVLRSSNNVDNHDGKFSTSLLASKLFRKSLENLIEHQSIGQPLLPPKPAPVVNNNNATSHIGFEATEAHITPQDDTNANHGTPVAGKVYRTSCK